MIPKRVNSFRNVHKQLNDVSVLDLRASMIVFQDSTAVYIGPMSRQDSFLLIIFVISTHNSVLVHHKPYLTIAICLFFLRVSMVAGRPCTLDREICGGQRGDQPSKACRRSRSIDREPAAGFAKPLQGSHVHACPGISIDGQMPDNRLWSPYGLRPSGAINLFPLPMHSKTP